MGWGLTETPGERAMVENQREGIKRLASSPSPSATLIDVTVQDQARGHNQHSSLETWGPRSVQRQHAARHSPPGGNAPRFWICKETTVSPVSAVNFAGTDIIPKS
eukprot:2244303-Rhodomonas_salina.2